MITIISPAKNMKVDLSGTKPVTMPYFIEEAKEIQEELKKWLPSDLQILMKINDKLAEDSFDRIQHMKFDMDGTSAIETYDGIQYKYMNPKSFSKGGKEFAQKHVRVLSGLYGVVRPYDSIYEYRLEMLTKVQVKGKENVDKSKNLYDFWGRKLYDRLIDEIEAVNRETDTETKSVNRETDTETKSVNREMGTERKAVDSKKGISGFAGKEYPVILNLASDEYAKTIRKYVTAPYRMITCHFKVYSKGRYKVQATAAKMARGCMVRYICENEVDNPEELKKFDWDGYRFEESLSNEMEYVFLKTDRETSV